VFSQSFRQEYPTKIKPNRVRGASEMEANSFKQPFCPFLHYATRERAGFIADQMQD